MKGLRGLKRTGGAGWDGDGVFGGEGDSGGDGGGVYVRWGDLMWGFYLGRESL